MNKDQSLKRVENEFFTKKPAYPVDRTEEAVLDSKFQKSFITAASDYNKSDNQATIEDFVSKQISTLQTLSTQILGILSIKAEFDEGQLRQLQSDRERIENELIQKRIKSKVSGVYNQSSSDIVANGSWSGIDKSNFQNKPDQSTGYQPSSWSFISAQESKDTVDITASTSSLWSNYGGINKDLDVTYDHAEDFYESSSVPKCMCNVPCIKLTSRQPTSMNREFYKCGNSRNSGKF